VLALKVVQKRKPGEGIPKSFGLQGDIHPQVPAVVLMRTQQLQVLCPVHLDEPRGKESAGGTDPMVVLDVCVMHQLICAGVYELDQILFLDIASDFDESAINESESAGVSRQIGLCLAGFWATG
jgi:hypothetical protein